MKGEYCNVCGAANAPYGRLWNGAVQPICAECFIKNVKATFEAIRRICKWAQTAPLNEVMHGTIVEIPDLMDNLVFLPEDSTFELEDLLDNDLPF